MYRKFKNLQTSYTRFFKRSIGSKVAANMVALGVISQ